MNLWNTKLDQYTEAAPRGAVFLYSKAGGLTIPLFCVRVNPSPDQCTEITMHVCELCEMEYDKQQRLGKPGRVTVCEDCAEEDTVPYTGYMVYGHKAGATLQINTDPALTEYLINATKLKNKGSNMTSNVQQVTKYSKLSKTEGACKQTADFWNYKGRAE